MSGNVDAAFGADETTSVVLLIFAIDAMKSDGLLASVTPGGVEFDIALLANDIRPVLEHISILLDHYIVENASIAKIASEAFAMVMEIAEDGVAKRSRFRPNVFRRGHDLLLASVAFVGVSGSRKLCRYGRRSRLARTVVGAMATHYIWMLICA